MKKTSSNNNILKFNINKLKDNKKNLIIGLCSLLFIVICITIFILNYRSNTNNKDNAIENKSASTKKHYEDESYIIFETEYAKLKLSKGLNIDNYEFKIDYLTMNNDFKNKVGSASEYFNVSLMDEKQKEFPRLPMIIEVDLNQSLELLGVYQNISNSLIPADYKIVDNKIEIRTVDLGEFLISYEKDAKKEIEEKIYNWMPTIIVGVLILIFAITDVVLIIKKKKS